ncbi:MAG: hypothetical protein Q4B70_13620, partial [Lachnospiraceae bacterium]|nr:hypothetical protein [Lachnospiraceae bacterium]
MAEYQRIVSYLYKYNHGQKGGNTGFVRVETRADGLRLFFQIKDLNVMDEKELKVYFYFHEQEKKKGIFVDKFLCSRGYCEYKQTINQDQILKDKELRDLDGMVFYDEDGLLYGTCWDEREIADGGIELPEENVKNGKEEIEIEVIQEEEEAGAGVLVPEVQIEPEQEPKPEPKPEQAEAQPSLEMEEIKESNEPARNPGIEQLLESSSPLPINWDSGLMKAVKIMPEDIAKLP